MGAGDGIALAAEVPGVGVGGGAEGAQIGKPGEEAPLRVHGAAGEDVGDEVTGEALGLQCVVVSVHLGVQSGSAVLGEVVVGLQHDGDDRHLLVLGDVGVGVARQDGLGPVGVIALRRGVGGRLHAVEEGVDEALGHVDLGGRPLVNEAVVGGAVVVDVVALGHVPHGESAEDGGGEAEEPQPGAGAAPDAEAEEEPAQDEDGQGQNHGLGEKELVLPRHVAGLLEKEQVLEHEGVVAELELEPAAHGEAQGEGGGEGVGQGGPAQDKVEQEVEEHHRGQVQKGDEGVLEVAQEHGLLVDNGGKDQAHKAHAQGGAQAPEEVPDPEEGGFPRRPVPAGMALKEGDVFHI